MTHGSKNTLLEQIGQFRMNPTRRRYTIGGAFELHLPTFGNLERLTNLAFDLTGTWTASGRAALALALRHLQRIGVRNVHLPSYLCKSILLPVQQLGFEYSFYKVDATLMAHPDPPSGAAVLLIHYFGWKNPATANLRAEAGKSLNLIEDASQALLSDLGFSPAGSQFIVLSPRKFGPTPLGGWCNVCAESRKPSMEIEALGWRSLAARLTRAAYLTEPDAPVDSDVEAFYLRAFRDVEKYLDTHPTSAPVPEIVLHIIAGLNWERIAVQRRANWHLLNELLPDNVESLMNELPEGVVPLGYVVRLRKRDHVRACLAEQRIFCPVHWLLPEEVHADQFPDSALLAQTSLTLPIDQRYGPDDMARMAQALKNLI